MFLFQFVKHIIKTVIEIYEILLIRWVDPQYPWSQGIGSLIWGSSMTRVKLSCLNKCCLYLMTLFEKIKNDLGHSNLFTCLTSPGGRK